MQLIAKLEQPYTETERMDFIVEQNHNKGYEIREKEEALEAWGYTDEEKAGAKEAEFDRGFFNTSLGYIRRSVTMADGSQKDFLADLLPAIKAGLEMGQEVTVLTYDKPDFTEDVTDWEKYQHKQLANAQFIGECLQQVVKDFVG